MFVRRGTYTTLKARHAVLESVHAAQQATVRAQAAELATVRAELAEARAAHHQVRTDLAEATRPTTLADLATVDVTEFGDTMRPRLRPLPDLPSADITSLGDLHAAAKAAGRELVDTRSLGEVIRTTPLPDLDERAQLAKYQAVSDLVLAGLSCPDCGEPMPFGQAHRCKPGSVS